MLSFSSSLNLSKRDKKTRMNCSCGLTKPKIYVRYILIFSFYHIESTGANTHHQRIEMNFQHILNAHFSFLLFVFIGIYLVEHLVQFCVYVGQVKQNKRPTKLVKKFHQPKIDEIKVIE